ncbi:MAG TPA: hypothetical protein VF522_23620 [Ramlibacter sp.]|uniref:hypothetical protein n=1 Tax=Ramlibacter sp. TaxID=1917967 RepID=UPI002ED16CD2
MNILRSSASAAIALVLAHAAGAQSAPPAPSFEVAYRAWAIATELARENGDPNIGGQCGKTFRPFVIPGLRMQNRQDQDVAATACVEAARSACANGKLRKSAETMTKCREFR